MNEWIGTKIDNFNLDCFHYLFLNLPGLPKPRSLLLTLQLHGWRTNMVWFLPSQISRLPLLHGHPGFITAVDSYSPFSDTFFDAKRCKCHSELLSFHSFELFLVHLLIVAPSTISYWSCTTMFPKHCYVTSKWLKRSSQIWGKYTMKKKEGFY